MSGFATASASAAAPEVTPGERVRALVEPSIVYVSTNFFGVAYDKVNRQLVRQEPFQATGGCSGFFVSPTGDVITAAHCVEKSQLAKDDVAAVAADWTTSHAYYKDSSLTPEDVVGDYDIRGLRNVTIVAYGVSASGDTKSGTARRAVVKGIRSFSQEAGDVALLKMLDVKDVPALQVAADNEVETLEDVWSIGYPGKIDYQVDDDFAPSFKDGSISSKKTRLDVPVYELSAAIAPGMSGGPTVDSDGNVIGVNSFGATAETEAFNFVQTAATVNDLLADKNVDNSFGETNTIYREGIEGYIDGDRSTAIENLEEVLTRVPNHALAREYLAKAEVLPDDSGMPGWAWILIALAVIGAITAGVYALLRSGRINVGSRAPKTDPSQRAPEDGRTTISSRPAEPTLVISHGPGTGQRFPITADVLLGREEADISLDDPEVSRRHAMIRRVNGTIEISDLRSANGTRINGSQIDGPRSVSDGDTIEVGQTTLTLEFPAGRGGSETATHRRPDDR
jgi:serine protease Do